jgi:hypothetical protein
MAGDLMTGPSDAPVLGWEWAPPPALKPSGRRRLEPKRPPGLLQLPPPLSPGMDVKSKAFLFFGIGGLLVPLAMSASFLFVFALPLLAYGGWLLHGEAQRSEQRRGLERADADRQRAFAEEHRRWSETIRQEEADTQRSQDTAPRWYPIQRLAPARRLDIFGGEPEGWASLLQTAFGAAVRSTPVTLLDLTRRNLAQRALWPDGDAPRSVVIPAQLGQFDPFVGARHPGEVAAALIGSQAHSDDWARRDVELGILRRVTDVLGGDVTLRRLLAAVTAPLAPESSLVETQLSDDERRALQDPKFVAMLGGDCPAHLGRLAAALEAVARAGADSAGRGPACLPFLPGAGAEIIATGDTGGQETRRRLDNLLAAGLADRISHAESARGLILVVGADRLSRPVLDALIEGVQDHPELRLAIFFEHLTGPAGEIIGRGASETVLMRLGHHEDALAGASFVGKEHRFVVSSITSTVGTQLDGSDTHGFTGSDSESYTDQVTRRDSLTDGGSAGATFNYGRTWSETENYREPSTRSEEFLTRAEDLQRIPTTGFVFVTAVNGRKHVILGDCHPAIAQTSLVAAHAIGRR